MNANIIVCHLLKYRYIIKFVFQFFAMFLCVLITLYMFCNTYKYFSCVARFLSYSCNAFIDKNSWINKVKLVCQDDRRNKAFIYENYNTCLIKIRYIKPLSKDICSQFWTSQSYQNTFFDIVEAVYIHFPCDSTLKFLYICTDLLLSLEWLRPVRSQPSFAKRNMIVIKLTLLYKYLFRSWIIFNE